MWLAITQCEQLVKLELSMPYVNCEGDYGNSFTELLDQDCLLELPRTLSVAMLSIPFRPKMTEGKDGSQRLSLPSLEAFNPQHLQSLILTTGILRHNNSKVRLIHQEGQADSRIQCKI